MAIRTQVREAFRQLLIQENVLAASKILLGKNDRIDAARLPIIRIRPSGGTYERSAMGGSFEDEFNLTIEVEVKERSTKDADTALEEFEESITEAIRTGSTTLDDLLHDYQITESSYEFDAEGKDRIGNLTITVETMLKP